MIDQSTAYRQQAVHIVESFAGEIVPCNKGLRSLYPLALLAQRANKGDRNKFYEFHDTYGHTTLQYCNLKNQVEDLIRNFYLDEFIDFFFNILDKLYIIEENTGDITYEQLVVRVIARDPMLARDSNRA